VAAGTRQVGGEGAYTSDPVVVKSDGVYRWQATYSGDERNESVVSTSCPTGDKIRPVLGTPTISPSRLKPGKKAIIKYSLSEAATVAFSVERALPGRRSGKSCGKPTTKNAGKKKCTRYVKLKGGFSQRGRKGSNKLSFNGKLGKKKLAPGSYRLRAVATDAAKNKSAAKLRSFRILP
jgi:hypothetical protein